VTQAVVRDIVVAESPQYLQLPESIKTREILIAQSRQSKLLEVCQRRNVQWRFAGFDKMEAVNLKRSQLAKSGQRIDDGYSELGISAIIPSAGLFRVALRNPEKYWAFSAF